MALALLFPLLLTAKEITVASPDGRLIATVSIGERITYALTLDGKALLSPSPISMTLKTGEVWGRDSRLLRTRKTSKREHIEVPFGTTRAIDTEYGETTLYFKGGWGLKFRVYDDAAAYRFFSTKDDTFFIRDEEANFIFPEDFPAFIPYSRSTRDPYFNSFENVYARSKLSEFTPGRLAFLPLLVEAHDGIKVCILEADLESYPGLFLTNETGLPRLKGDFAEYPKKMHQGGHNMLQQVVDEREDYIAKVTGPRDFPWRALLVTREDKELTASNLTYRLADPSRIKDTSWIKPGKVAWEWWNDWNLYGVDFKAGINNDTYKYYIDFASLSGIEYVILDEGWAVNQQADLMQVVPEIDLEELVAYGKERNVGIILWAGYWAFDRDMEEVCRHYSEMGIKGFKIDFMDRDDQVMTDFIYRAAETLARYRLLADFHGMYKPDGIQRTYPNVLNFEGVYGLEQAKWTTPDDDLVTYEVTIPFIRMAAGPMDYTQGAMRNATKANFRAVYSEPMSQGTRCRQLAQYVIFDSPINMLCDSPSNYLRETESLDYIARIPTVWDETIPLDGKVAEYLAIARRKGDVWYVGGMTNWTEREQKVFLSFLPKGKYRLTLFKDGPNASRAAQDYTKEVLETCSSDSLSIRMAPGGGFAAMIEPLDQ